MEGSPVDFYCWLPGAGMLMGGGGVRKVQVGGYPGFRFSPETNDRGRTGPPPVDDVLAVACVPAPGAPTPKGPGTVLPVLVQCDAVGSAALLATCERVAATVGMPGLRAARPGR